MLKRNSSIVHPKNPYYLNPPNFHLLGKLYHNQFGIYLNRRKRKKDNTYCDEDQFYFDFTDKDAVVRNISQIISNFNISLFVTRKP